MSHDYAAEMRAQLAREDRRFRAIVVAVVIAIGLGVWWLAANTTDERGDHCRAAGGTVKTSSKSITGINPSNGQPVVSSITISACINKEGNVTDVW